MKRFISVIIITLLVMLSIDILGLSLTNSTIPNSTTAQTAYAESIELNQDEAITKATKLKDVSISPSKFTLAPGKTRQLNFTLTPSSASLLSNTEWESENKGIASVDKNGKVTAIKEGITIIRFMTWGEGDGADYFEASTICVVSNKALKAEALTKNDFQLTIDGKKVNFSTTYDQIKKMFPGGKEDKDAGPDLMAYMAKGKKDEYGRTGYAYYFYFNKKGTDNKKVLAILCCYYANDISVKTPRGIKLGSSTIVDVVKAYGYPISYYGGNADDRGIDYEKKIGKDNYRMWMGQASPFDSISENRIVIIFMSINGPTIYL